MREGLPDPFGYVTRVVGEAAWYPVASVSVWFRSKERPRNGNKSQKIESGGRGKGRKETSFLSSPPPPSSFTGTIFRAGLGLSFLVLCS